MRMSAAHHDPVLGAMVMLLQREPPARLDDDALDLVTIYRLIRTSAAMHLEMIVVSSGAAAFNVSSRMPGVAQDREPFFRNPIFP
jgi:hypothetical protein